MSDEETAPRHAAAEDGRSRSDAEADVTAAPADAAMAMPPLAHEFENAEDAGVVVNPEVTAPPQPPPAAAGTGDPSPWARPANPRVTGWDQSGYAPPPPVRLEQPLPPMSWAPVGVQPLAGSGAMAAPLPAAAVVPARPASERRSRYARVQLRPGLTILLFIAGLAAGVVGLRLATPALTASSSSSSFPSLDRSAVEPAPAGAVAQELALNDVQGLAQLLDGDTLTAIQSQLKPLVSFESLTFVGATAHDHDTLAGYVVRGRDQDGNLGLVGLVIRLRDGQVVAK